MLWAKALLALACALGALGGTARAQGSYNVVAQMEIGAPASTSFVLHGTLPVPPGTFPRNDHKVPFALLDANGSVVDTQMEVVTRYPIDSDGADVVEILGRVNKPAGTAAGARLIYKVVEYPHLPGGRQIGAVPSSLLQTPGSVMLVAKDCFGHTYGVDLTSGVTTGPTGNTHRTLKSGKAHTQVSVYGTMLPQTTNIGAPNGALQHLFGVHGYFSVWQGEDVIGLDLRVNNGASGNDGSSSIDNPLGKVYFQSLELWIKSGWNVLQQAADPMFGGSMSQGSWTAYSIIEPNADGTLHYMPAQGQFIRRLALCKIGQETKAQALLNNEGLAFVKRGVSPSGMELYSWWNPLTARYFPQRHRLPELDHIGMQAIRSQHHNQLAIQEAALVNGTSATGFGMILTPNLGWAHPWGVKYGGMTGGGEISIFDGITTADAASGDGYKISQLVHRQYVDRQPDALYNRDGKPTHLLDWVHQGPTGPYVNFFFYGKLLSGPDPFGFGNASQHQVNWVAASNKKPAYEVELSKYMPIDLQHKIRLTRSMKVLAWLGNDSLAKDDLRACAEIFRMSWHDMPNNASNAAQGGGLLDASRYIASKPSCGFKIGRGEGWGIDTVNAAYALGDNAYRASVMPWYRKMATTLAMGQSACNGYLQSQVSPKWVQGLYYARQQFEASIVENGLRGAVESVLRGVDPANTAALEDVLSDQIEAMISVMAWDPVQKGPWKNLAMAPLNSPTTPYCNFVPPGGTDPGVEKFQNWSSFAYGFEISQNQALLDYAKLAMGGDLKTVIQGQKFKDLDTRAALLALVQRP